MIVNFKFQYLTPHSHQNLLHCIVETHRYSFVEDIINNSFTQSLRCDRNVDQTQIDKMCMLIKSITLEGNIRLDTGTFNYI